MLWNSAKQFCTYILDTLFPVSHREQRVRAYHESPLPMQEKIVHLDSVAIQTLTTYKNAHVKDAIGAAKFEHSEAATLKLAQLVDDFLIAESLEHALTNSDRIIVAPVPLHATRLRERGRNQVDTTLRRTRAVTEGFVEYVPDLLSRVRDTAPQATLPRSARLTNVRGAFTCTTRIAEQYIARTIYLFDDVATTGATLSAAHDALARHDIRPILVAIARA